MPALLAGAILLANWLGRGGNAHAVGDVPAAPAAPVTVRLAVDPGMLVAGRPLAATVSVVNHTNRALTVACTPSGWPAATLTGAGAGAGAHAIGLTAPCPSEGLPLGLSRFALSGATEGLRAGSYQLSVVPGEMPAGTSLPAPVTIRLISR